jgi:adenylate cyclase
MTDSPFRQRLAAILAADAAGYSRLMAIDEAATVATLDAARTVFRARIEAHGGRVIDMAGDSVLAVFDTAIGAVSAALAVQRELSAADGAQPEAARMRFRIGIHLGDVIEKGDGTVYGDGVNIAARLQALAEPGGVSVSDAVQGAVRGKLTATFADRGEQAVKNMPHPVRAFAVLTADAAQGSEAPLPALAPPSLLSIAVLPFDNMSGDPEQDYFADGMVEDIITALARMRVFFVIARNSSFVYKGRAVDILQRRPLQGRRVPQPHLRDLPRRWRAEVDQARQG